MSKARQISMSSVTTRPVYRGDLTVGDSSHRIQAILTCYDHSQRTAIGSNFVALLSGFITPTISADSLSFIVLCGWLSRFSDKRHTYRSAATRQRWSLYHKPAPSWINDRKFEPVIPAFQQPVYRKTVLRYKCIFQTRSQRRHHHLARSRGC